MDINFYLEKIKGEYLAEFEKLYKMLSDRNKICNLTAICEREEVFLKHFLDSVVGEKYFLPDSNVAEIGSGGGFPSIPLKIVRPDLAFTLIESTGKKCKYLQDVVDNFNFKNMNVKNIRAEDGARDINLREKFDVSTARAVARLNTLCEYCMPYVKVGGRFIAYKGDADEELKEAEKAIKVLGGELECVEKYSILGGDKRTLIIVKKIKPTPEKYPRGNGKERKQPI
ncbi:MAG: 16S rRNA (guanine(527)-N(7))-methyltransferase RsmG [Candidatus Coproplasma sp.]